MIGSVDLDALLSRVDLSPSKVSPDIEDGTTDVSWPLLSSELLLSGGRVTSEGILHVPDLDVLATLDSGLEVIVPVPEAEFDAGMDSPEIDDGTTEVSWFPLSSLLLLSGGSVTSGGILHVPDRDVELTGFEDD